MTRSQDLCERAPARALCAAALAHACCACAPCACGVPRDGWTALHFACKSGLLPLIPWRALITDELIDDCGFGLRTGSHLTVLHVAAWNLRQDVVQMLLLSMRAYQPGWTPLRVLVKRNVLTNRLDTAADLAIKRPFGKIANAIFTGDCFASSCSGARARARAFVRRA